ncbi:MAG TPA: surface lipoprotein assembly modifier [Gammaproteobacteria bacterium]|nr:surface lipoprotein assembly modifier [Gammaproteobacteria bacterium]
MAAAAQDAVTPTTQDRAVAINLGAGFEYDSNVAVLELDTSTNAGDRAALLDFGIAYDKAGTGRFDVQAGYDFSQSLHDDFDAFDVRIHRGSATLSYDLGRVDIGTTLQHAYAELDGSEFLTLKQISPYLSKLVGQRLFLRFSYAHSDKEFASSPSRAATADALSSDVYVFVDGLTTYLLFGYRHDDEDAIDAQFDYGGDMFRVQLTKRLNRERELTLRTSVRVEDRDYDSPTPSIGAPRRDDRTRLEVSLEVPMGERTVAQIAYEHADNRSNLPSVDFAENVVSVRFRTRF